MSSLDHLSAEQVSELMRRYYAEEATVAELKAKFGITARTGIHTLFPPLIHDDLKCPWCAVAMVSERPSKTRIKDSKSRWGPRMPDPKCPACGHVEGAGCRCATCSEQAAQLTAARQSAQQKEVLDYYLRRSQRTWRPDELSLKKRILLASLLRCNECEEWWHVRPLSQSPVPLTPSEDWTIRILRELQDDDTIVISPDSPMDAFNFQDGGSFRYFPLNVHYELNIESYEEEFGRAVLHPPRCHRDDDDIPDVLELWREIAFHEVLDFLNHMVGEYNLRFKVGPKTQATISTLLEDFSTAQVNGFVWGAVKDAAALVQKRTHHPNHAANTIPGAMQRRGERAIANGWEPKCFGRNFKCPQSVLSSTFFNRVVAVGDRGFNEPLSAWTAPSYSAVSGPPPSGDELGSK